MEQRSAPLSTREMGQHHQETPRTRAEEGLQSSHAAGGPGRCGGQSQPTLRRQAAPRPPRELRAQNCPEARCSEGLGRRDNPGVQLVKVDKLWSTHATT